MRHDTERGMLTAVSGIGAWIVPAWGCPACLSAFAGTMSALGLGFVASKAVLTPLTVAFLTIAVLALGFGARKRRVYGPLVLGRPPPGCSSEASSGTTRGSDTWGCQLCLLLASGMRRAAARPVGSRSLTLRQSSVGQSERRDDDG